MSEELTAVLLCGKLNWTYDEYLDNPSWFNTAMITKFSVEADVEKKLSKKQK